MSNKNKMIKYNGEVYQKKDTPFYSLWVKAKITEAPPNPVWKKGLMSFAMWQEMKAWLQLSYEKFKSETMLLLFFDETKDEWSYWIPPQDTSGMTVSVDEDSEIYAQERKAMPDMGLGSIHHHNTTGAFQSGTDSKDELEKPGFHFTFGHMNKDKLDLHARFCAEGECHVTHPALIVAMPDWMASIPEHYQWGLMCQELETALTEEQLEPYKKKFEPQFSKVNERSFNNSSVFKKNKYRQQGLGSQASFYDSWDEQAADWEKKQEEGAIETVTNDWYDDEGLENLVKNQSLNEKNFMEELATKIEAIMASHRKVRTADKLCDVLDDFWQDPSNTFLSKIGGACEECLLLDEEKALSLGTKVDLMTNRIAELEDEGLLV